MARYERAHPSFSMVFAILKSNFLWLWFFALDGISAVASGDCYGECFANPAAFLGLKPGLLII
jgi:hypothetical protein